VSKHLLILRPDNLGDAILFSGALRHIRRKFRGYSITLCAKRYTRDYFELCPHIDSFLAWEDLLSALNSAPELPWYPTGLPGKGRMRLLWGTIRKALFVRRTGVDEIIVPVRSPQSGWVDVLHCFPGSRKTGLTGDSSNMGLDEHRAYAAALNIAVDVSDLPQDGHEFSATLRLLERLGMTAATGDFSPEYWTSKDDALAARRMLGPCDGPLVVLAPGKTSLAAGKLDPSFYAKALGPIRSSKITVALIGTVAEERYCSEVAAALKNVPVVAKLVFLPGKTTTRQTVELLKLAHAVVSEDTAALHMAVMVRAPTVGIVGGGHFNRFFPWGNPDLVKAAYRQLACFGCNWRCIHSTLRCITEIEPGTVSEHLSALLERR
jgi:ADP-heptose:LPS heptosyltransferase